MEAKVHTEIVRLSIPPAKLAGLLATWRMEVLRGDTLLGFYEWAASRI